MNLKDRLDRYAKTAGIMPPEPRMSTPPPSSKCEHLAHVFPSHHSHGTFAVNALHGQFASAAQLLLSRPLEGSIDFTDIAFIDTETTGLSGGIGVCAFLVGIGYLSSEGFVVEQFLMNDFPAESHMLEGVCRKLDTFPCIASYNGRSFDVPILEGRMLLNGLRFGLSKKPHMDLLHPSRRIWKHRLSECSLKSVEANVLNYPRINDIEGWMIPQTYFSYLRTGNKCLLEQILLHNRLDLLSLACITHLALKAVDFPAQAPFEHGEDWYGLGTFFARFRDSDKAAYCFERAMQVGLPDSLARRCRQSLSLMHKKAGNWGDAVKLWDEASRSPGGAELFDLEELAKYFEHRLRDFLSARDVCRRAITLLEVKSAISTTDTSDHLLRFEHRLNRIEHKIKKGSACATDFSHRHFFFSP